MAETKVTIPKLEGSSNYDIWAIRMQALLAEKGLDKCLDPEIIDTELYEQNKATALIRLALKDGPLLQTKLETDPLQIWRRLQTLYEPKGFSSEFLICKELFKTTLANTGKNIESFLNKIKRLTDDLAARNLGLPTKVIAAYVLNNLTPEYEQTVAIISQTFRQNSSKEIDLDLLFSQLLDESRRLVSTRGPTGENLALSSYTDSRGKLVCTFCGLNNHSEDKCFRKHPELRNKGPKATPRKPYKANKPKGQRDNVSLNTTIKPEKKKQEETAIITPKLFKELAFFANNSTTWVLDSGASRHICSNRALFQSLEPTNITLEWGKASEIPVKEKGEIRVKFNSTSLITTIKDCLYAPELGVNLLSLGLLTDKGFSVEFKGKDCLIKIGKDLLFKGNKSSNVFVLDTTPILPVKQSNAKAYSTTTTTSAKIWHDRLGHAGKNSLAKLPENSLGVSIKPKDNLPTLYDCEVCVQAKGTQSISRQPSTKAEDLLEVVFSDICGPISPTTLSKYRYFSTFLDSYSKWVEVVLLRTRDEVLNAFKVWLKREENQSRKKLKRFHSDNALEYLSAEFKEFTKELGIIHTNSAPRTPEQNGSAERINLTLLNKVRTALISSGLPKYLWGEALESMAYIYNRTPHSALGFKTPYELKYKSKPDLTSLKIWGSLTYSLDKRNNLKKLDPRTNAYVLIGYGSNQYKLLDISKKATFYSRDVYVLEGKFLKDRDNLEHLDISKELEVSNDSIEAMPEPLELEDLNIRDKLPIEDPKPLKEPLERYEPDESDELPPSFLDELVEAAALHTNVLDQPSNIKEVRSSPNADKWLAACTAELEELKRQNTWTLVPRPSNRKILKGRWVLRTKPNIEDPSKPKYKARWVAKGFLQRFGLDFNETYANTVNPISYRLFLALAALLDYEIKQWDIKSAYPNAPVKETIYVEQPTSFEDTTKPDYVCLLNKALYGLKQSAREWEHFLRDMLSKHGLEPLKIDQSVYISTKENQFLVVITYVDDMLIISNSTSTIKDLYAFLSTYVTVTDLGDVQTFLGIDIVRDRPKKSIYLSQKSYTDKILAKYARKGGRNVDTPCLIGQKLEHNTAEPDPSLTKTYQKELGSLMYLMTKTRPDLAYPIGLAARFMSNPNLGHHKALDRIWKYLENTRDLGLYFQSDKNPKIVGFCDSDWGGDLGTRRSTTGYLFTLNGTAISWNSKLQRTVALSSCEAEYMSFKEAILEQLFIASIISEVPKLGSMFSDNKTLYTDSKSAIELAKNPIFHSRTKHIDIQYHFIRENVSNSLINLVYMPTDLQLADPLTKPLDGNKFKRFLNEIGLKTLL